VGCNSTGRYTVGRKTASPKAVSLAREFVVRRLFVLRTLSAGVRRPTRACSQVRPCVKRRVTMIPTLAHP
jgi:hypothetical protein